MPSLTPQLTQVVAPQIVASAAKASPLARGHYALGSMRAFTHEYSLLILVRCVLSCCVEGSTPAVSAKSHTEKKYTAFAGRTGTHTASSSALLTPSYRSNYVCCLVFSRLLNRDEHHAERCAQNSGEESIGRPAVRARRAGCGLSEEKLPRQHC